MKKLWQLIGITVFWLSWPLLWIFLKFSVRTRVLVVCGDEVLLVKNWRGNGKWCLPGGGLRPGEDPISGAIRELKEELGLRLTARQVKPIGRRGVLNQGLMFNYYELLVTYQEKPGVHNRPLEIVDSTWMSVKDLNTTDIDGAAGASIAGWLEVR